MQESHRAKEIDCMFGDDDLGKFLVNTDLFCKDYILKYNEYGVNSRMDVFTLALYEAIYSENVRLVKFVLDAIGDYPNEIGIIFTSVVWNGFSPVYLLLLSDNKDINKLLSDYIKTNSDSITKVIGNKNDLANIESLLERAYYSGNGKSKVETYYNKFLCYLYEDVEISEFINALIGECVLPAHSAMFRDYV